MELSSYIEKFDSEHSKLGMDLKVKTKASYIARISDLPSDSFLIHDGVKNYEGSEIHRQVAAALESKSILKSGSYFDVHNPLKVLSKIPVSVRSPENTPIYFKLSLYSISIDFATMSGLLKGNLKATQVMDEKPPIVEVSIDSTRYDRPAYEATGFKELCRLLSNVTGKEMKISFE